jgi:hypothetical protein
MKYVALVAALVVALGLTQTPARAASTPESQKVYCTTQHGMTWFVVPGDAKPFMVPAQLAQFVTPKCTDPVPSFEAAEQTISGIALPMPGFGNPQLPKFQLASIAAGDLIGRGTTAMLYNLNGALYITPDPSGGALPVSISSTFNTTAPVLTNGQTSVLQSDSAGALLTADGGKTYVLLNQVTNSCTNLFSGPIRVNEISNPGLAQTHPFGLYDSTDCSGPNLFGNAVAQITTGPLLAQGQFIRVGVKTTTGLSVQWSGGQATTGSIPYLQVQ